jgi:hypothetical protein
MTYNEKYSGKNKTIKILSQLTLRMEIIKTDAIMQLKLEVTEWGWKKCKCAV